MVSPYDSEDARTASTVAPTAHTPGPWIQHDFDRQRICDADPVKQIARTLCGTGVRERAEAEANARLIAAAPDLLAALKIARKAVYAMAESSHLLEGFGPRKRNFVDEELAAVDAAIARAEGR